MGDVQLPLRLSTEYYIAFSTATLVDDFKDNVSTYSNSTKLSSNSGSSSGKSKRKFPRIPVFCKKNGGGGRRRKIVIRFRWPFFVFTTVKVPEIVSASASVASGDGGESLFSIDLDKDLNNNNRNGIERAGDEHGRVTKWDDNYGSFASLDDPVELVFSPSSLLPAVSRVHEIEGVIETDDVDWKKSANGRKGSDVRLEELLKKESAFLPAPPPSRVHEIEEVIETDDDRKKHYEGGNQEAGGGVVAELMKKEEMVSSPPPPPAAILARLSRMHFEKMLQVLTSLKITSVVSLKGRTVLVTVSQAAERVNRRMKKVMAIKGSGDEPPLAAEEEEVEESVWYKREPKGMKCRATEDGSDSQFYVHGRLSISSVLPLSPEEEGGEYTGPIKVCVLNEDDKVSAFEEYYH